MARRANFQQLAIDLCTIGLSHEDLARLCECSLSTVRRLRSGELQEPQYQTGRHLIRLYSRLILKEIDVPPANPELIAEDN